MTPECNTQRVPRESQAVPIMPGNDGLIGSNGPLARSLRDVDLFMNVVLGTQPWLREQSLVPLPWREPTLALANRRLRIGIIQHDGVVLPQPPTRRALDAMIQALRKDSRFELVDFAPLNHAQGIKLAVSRDE
jgi:amidase